MSYFAVVFEREGEGGYSAMILELNASGYGRTREEAVAVLTVAAQNTIFDMLRRGGRVAEPDVSKAMGGSSFVEVRLKVHLPGSGPTK